MLNSFSGARALDEPVGNDLADLHQAAKNGAQ
jgi:hypothetical protein